MGSHGSSRRPGGMAVAGTRGERTAQPRVTRARRRHAAPRRSPRRCALRAASALTGHENSAPMRPNPGGTSMKLHYFPLSTYSQKVLTALYEKGIAFTPALIQPSVPEQRAGYLAVNPLGKVPALVLDNGDVLTESTTIIEYLD